MHLLVQFALLVFALFFFTRFFSWFLLYKVFTFAIDIVKSSSNFGLAILLVLFLFSLKKIEYYFEFFFYILFLLLFMAHLSTTLKH